MRIRAIAQVTVVGLVLAVVGAGSSAQGAAEPGVVHFTAAGDYGNGSNSAAVLTATGAQDADLNLALGDLSYAATGAEQAWCDFVTQRVGAGFPFELLAGNHESNGQNGNINDFSACLPNQLPGLVGTYGRQWYVDVPQIDPVVRFVMISPAIPFTNDGTLTYASGTPQYNWTAAAIDGARSAAVPWVVVGVHKPCWSLGQYTCELHPDLQRLLLTKRVDLVLNGHEHLYQRTKQLALGAGCATSIPTDSYNPACVADADSDLGQGAGTVFATVGTGGAMLRTVNDADPEAGYFVSSSGSNKDAAYGLLDVRATAEDLTARFVPVGGATFTDAFVIHRGTPPPNQAPTAVFTSSSQGLTAAFDGNGSADPDGQIAAYAWAFGDGTTGAGPAPTHAYPSAGTYQVTLTVTDNSGATGTVTRPVTVTAPPTNANFVTDTFNRTVANGLGTADLGGAWSTSGTASNFSVAPGAAALRVVAGNTLAGWLGATTRTDTDLRLRLSMDLVPNGSTYLNVMGRRVGTNLEYDGGITLTSAGRVNVSLIALRGTSAGDTIAPAIQLPTSITYGPGTQLNVRLQVTGTSPTTIRMKVWSGSSAEPAAWQVTATDNGASLQVPGSVGLMAYMSRSVTNGPAVLRMSALTAQPTG